MKEMDSTQTTLVFDRTPVARLISCAAAFGSAALLFDYVAREADDLRALPLFGFGVLVVGTILSAILQYGDHIYVGPAGLLYENRLLPFLARGARWISWDDVVEVREIRRKILILLSNDGKRILVDAIAGYSIARREILKRAPHAVISGTLTREDRP